MSPRFPELLSLPPGSGSFSTRREWSLWFILFRTTAGISVYVKKKLSQYSMMNIVSVCVVRLYYDFISSQINIYSASLLQFWWRGLVNWPASSEVVLLHFVERHVIWFNLYYFICEKSFSLDLNGKMQKCNFPNIPVKISDFIDQMRHNMSIYRYSKIWAYR